MKPVKSDDDVTSIEGSEHGHATSHGHRQEIPEVESPYAGTRLSAWLQIKLSAVWFASNFVWGALLLVMLPHEIKDLATASHLDRAKLLGLITGTAAIVALFVPLVIGALSDRCASKWGRRRPYITVGVAINLAGIIAMAAGYGSSSLPVFFFAYVLVQFGNNVASSSFSGLIPDLVPQDQRGSASGYMAVMSQVGTLAGSFLVGVGLNGRSETVKYGVICAVVLLVSLLTIFGIKETPLPYEPPPLRWKPYLKSLWIDPRVYPDFAWVWITRALVMLGFYTILPFVQYYLSDVVHVAKPEETAPILLAIILVGATASGYIGGAISDRIGRKRVVYVANMVIAVMTIALIFCATIPQTLLVGVLFGLGYGAYISVDWALGTDVLPSDKDAAKDMAVWHVSMTFPQAIGGPVAGFILSSFGQRFELINGERVPHYNTSGYAAVFILSAIAFLLGAFLLRNVKKVK